MITWSGETGLFQDAAIFVAENRLDVALRSLELELTPEGFTPSVAASIYEAVRLTQPYKELASQDAERVFTAPDKHALHSGAVWSTAPANRVMNDARTLVLAAGSGGLRHHQVDIHLRYETCRSTSNLHSSPTFLFRCAFGLVQTPRTVHDAHEQSLR